MTEKSNAAAESEIPELKPLYPQYDESSHSPYVKRLEKALQGEDTKIHNIALSGVYGSGKSSILEKVVKDLEEERPHTTRTISLAPLAAQLKEQDDKKNDSIIPVTPLDENVESLFSYDDEGHIYGRTTDAQKTIEILNLDCSTIVHRRKAAFEAYSSLDSASDIEWASEIARLKGRNKDNQYEEYCFAVIYFIEHYLAI